MATETTIRIRRNPYHGYEVWIYDGKKLTRRSFDNSIDLSIKLAAEKFDDETIEDACDLLESLEWEEPEYPLGVSYRPVDNGCDCETCRSFPAKDRKPTGEIRENVVFWFKGVFWVGAVTVPWFGGFQLVRWAGGW